MHTPKRLLLQLPLQLLMMYKYFVFSISLLLSVASNFSFAQSIDSELVVEKIVVEGAGDFTDQALEGMLIAVDKPLSAELISASEDWLWQNLRMRVMQSYQREGSSPNSVVVVFVVSQLKSWKHVVFEGYDELVPPDIEAAIGLVGQAVDESELKKYEQRIIDYYYQQGFRGTEVFADDRGDHLVFVIQESTQLTIRDVQFNGNTHFNVGSPWGAFHLGIDLYETINQSDGIFSDDEFSEDLVIEDVNALVLLYREFGFLDAEVACTVEEHEADNTVTLVYEISQGPRYVVRSVNFVNVDGGELLIDESELLEETLVTASSYYNPIILRRDSIKITNLYGKLGRPTSAKVMSRGTDKSQFVWVGSESGPGLPQVNYDENEPVLDVVFVINEGKNYRLRDVVLQGYLGSEDRVVRRQIELEPGQEAREDKAVLSWRRLNGLNYFKDEANNPSVEWYWQQVETNPELLDVVFNVQDKGSQNNFRFGGAWNSETGPALMVSLSKSNVDIWDLPSSFSDTFTDLIEGKAFHGSGQSFNLTAQPGRDFSSFGISFTEPDLLNEHLDRLGLNLNANRNLRYLRSNEERRGSFGLTFNRRFGRYFSLFAGPSLGKVNILDPREGAPSNLIEGVNSTVNLMAGARWNTIADPFSPVDGSSFSVNLTQTGGFLGGDWDYLKSSVRGTKHFPLWEDSESRRWILSLKGAAHKSWLLGDMSELPYSESYFQGGNRTLRGFSYRGINLDANGFATPGAAAWNASVEMGFPLYATRQRNSIGMLENLRGAAFVDFGSVGPDFGEFAPTRVSAGIAFKLRLPVMAQVPLSFVLAKPISSEDGDQTSTFSFLLGSF